MTDENNLLLGQIDGKLDMVLDHVKDHNLRITSLERTRSYGLGFAAAIGSIVSLLGSKIANALGLFH